MRADNDERLHAGLRALAERTESAAADVDLADDIMAAVQAESGPAPIETPWWRRPWLVPAVVAVAAAAALFVALPRAVDSGLRLSAPDGAVLSIAGEQRDVRGADISVPVSSVVSTGPAQVATLRSGEQKVEVWADSSLVIDAAGSFRVASGAVAFTTPKELSVRARDAVVVGRGHFAVEANLPSQLESPMKILTKYRVAAASAAIALAVFTGWATLSSGASETEVKSPGGVFLDGEGRAQRFGLGAGSDGDPASLGSGAGSSDPAGDPDAEGERELAGAFWDEDKQVIAFTVPGEVVDANSGEPITAFEITSVATESAGYGQSRPGQWSFSGAGDGKFSIPGLGLGAWRLTITAEGYAPLTTNLDLTKLDADPYLVVPLWMGATLSGQVVDWRGRPVAGARIGMTACFERKDDKTCGLTKSGADGTFSLPGLPEDQTFSIFASHPRYGFASEQNIRRSPDSTEHVVIELSGIVRIFGEASRGKQRTPAVGVVVSDRKDSRATTDHNGVYEMFAPLQSRPQAFVETLDGDQVIGRAASYPESRSAWTLQWVESPTHVAEVRIDFRLAMEDATLFGQVTDASGKPMSNIELDLANTAGWTKRDHETYPTYTRTDASGRYRIENIPAGAGYRVRYRISEQDRWKPLGYVNVEDQSEVEANFALGTATIRGRFVDRATGEAIAEPSGACLRFAARSAGGTYAQPHCYADGRFEFENLAPGDYELHNPIEWMTSPVEFVSKKVSVAAGSIVEGIDIAVDGERSDVWRFRILNAKGRFLLGAFVRIHAGNTSFTSNLDVEPDGTASHSVNRKYREIFIDAPGYESVKLDLSTRDPAKLIEVRLDKLP